MYMYKKDAYNAKKKGTTTYKNWELKGQSTVLMKQFSQSLESSQGIIQIHVLTVGPWIDSSLY